MSLRLRVALLFALLVGATTVILGFVLRWGLEQRLTSKLDKDLALAMDLARPLVGFEPEGGVIRFLPDKTLEVLPKLLPEVVLLLVGRDGITDALGRLPDWEVLGSLGRPYEGYSFWNGWRLLGESVGDGLHLVVALPYSSIRETLGFMDGLLQWLLPLFALGSFVFVYLLSGSALAPAHRLAEVALRLAERREWRSRLPEPPTHDELWMLARAVNQLLAALQEVIERERSFSQEVSHALRTPLAVLLGRLERLLPDPRVEPALRAVEELHKLVERFLLLARVEGGGLYKEALELDALAFEVAEDLRPLFEAKGLSLSLEVPAYPIPVHGDRLALKASLHALLENALKFTPVGRVGIRVWDEGEWACVEVWDTGPGLGGLEGKTAFERFRQGGSRKGGSGLGLYLVERVVRWHGGKVWAKNRPQGGAKVGFALPLASQGSGGF